MITTFVPSFTKVPNINDSVNFENDTNTFLNEINARYVAGNEQATQMNTVADEVNTNTINAKAYQDTAKTYRDQSLDYKNLSLTYKTATELAYNNTQTLLSTLVIPTEATYNYQGANSKFAYKTDSFLNFKIGE